MSNKAGKRLVPALRFPEFQREAGWEIQLLRQLAKLIEDRAGTEKYTLLSITSGVGLVTQIEKFGREIAGDQYKNYFVIRRGDFAYNKSATKKDPEGFIALLESHEQAAVPNSIFTCFRLKNECNSPQFFKHLFSTNIHGNWLRRFITIGARANGSLNIDSSDLLSLPLGLPTSSEQRKIADCLSSLDDLITAQAKKIEALKAHKKGLMQQLFPAEGETVPRLRFPEFKGADEWQIVSLGELGKTVSGLTYSPQDIRESGLLVLRSSNVQNGAISLDDCVYVVPNIKGANISKPNDILICVRNGSASLIGKSALIPVGMPLSTHGAFMTVFRAKEPKFVYQLFQTTAYLDQVAADLGARINSINNGQLVDYKFSVPTPPEQEKIANFLCSVDEHIASHAQKLEVLKLQKQGLMQGLFPSMNEAEA